MTFAQHRFAWRRLRPGAALTAEEVPDPRTDVSEAEV